MVTSIVPSAPGEVPPPPQPTASDTTATATPSRITPSPYPAVPIGSSIVTALLALVSAVLVGGADFLVSLAARRSHPEAVPVYGSAASLLTIAVAVSFVDAPSVRGLDLAWGAAAGAFGAVAFVLFLHAMSRGQMSIVAPIAATVGAVTTVAVGLGRGERLEPSTWSGIVLAALAIALISSTGDGASGSNPHPHSPGNVRSVVLLAIGAGIGFGVFFSALAMTEGDAGLWPLVPARLVSLPTLVAVNGLRGGSWRIDRPARRLALWGGAIEGIASVILLIAVQRGPLAVAGVLGSLYPVSTVFLAWLVVGERLSRLQWIGVSVALAAVPMISA